MERDGRGDSRGGEERTKLARSRIDTLDANTGARADADAEVEASAGADADADAAPTDDPDGE